MNVEVVAAGVAANELRNDGDECGEKDDARADETLGPEPGRRISDLRSLRVRRSCSLIPVPCSLFLSWQQAQRVAWFGPRPLPA